LSLLRCRDACVALLWAQNRSPPYLLPGNPLVSPHMFPVPLTTAFSGDTLIRSPRRPRMPESSRADFVTSFPPYSTFSPSTPSISHSPLAPIPFLIEAITPETSRLQQAKIPYSSAFAPLFVYFFDPFYLSRLFCHAKRSNGAELSLRCMSPALFFASKYPLFSLHPATLFLFPGLLCSSRLIRTDSPRPALTHLTCEFFPREDQAIPPHSLCAVLLPSSKIHSPRPPTTPLVISHCPS